MSMFGGKSAVGTTFGFFVFSSLFCAQAFAWSISGTVQSSTGEPLSGVMINSFNHAGVSAKTDNVGHFSIDENTAVLSGVADLDMKVRYANQVLSIENVHASIFKVSAIDALGKVVYQRSLQHVFGNVSLDFSKVSAHGVKFIRINIDGTNSSYMLTGSGSLFKDGAPLPNFSFRKEGYEAVIYQMSQENETGVSIIMNPASSDVESSSSAGGTNPTSNSQSGTFTPPDVPTTCAGKTATPGDYNMSVVVDGKTRTFIMHVPSAYNGSKPVPMVVDYHPIGGSGAGQMADYGGSTYKSKTDPEGVISLYPDGTDGVSPMGAGWNVGPCCSRDDDVKFSREMIKKVEEIACINPRKIYATGFSMGGGMSNHVACNMSDVFAAVAPAAMDLNRTNSVSCSIVRPISVIMFRGTQDNICPYAGGESFMRDGLDFLGAENNFKFWAEKDGCTDKPTTNSSGCQEYSNCNGGAKVVLCTDKNGANGTGNGHDQGNGSIGWPFLKQFELK